MTTTCLRCLVGDCMWHCTDCGIALVGEPHVDRHEFLCAPCIDVMAEQKAKAYDVWSRNLRGPDSHADGPDDQPEGDDPGPAAA